MSYLKGTNGEKSSKRLVGLAYALLGIVIVLAMTFLDDVEVGFDILLLVVGTSMTALGISSLEYFGKPENLRNTSSTVDPTKPGGPKT